MERKRASKGKEKKRCTRGNIPFRRLDCKEIVGACRVGSAQGILSDVQGARDGMKIKIQHETEMMDGEIREAN